MTVANVVCVWVLIGAPALNEGLHGHLDATGALIVLGLLAGFTALLLLNHHNRRRHP